MSEHDDITQKVLESLRERPTLNTPALIATGPFVPDDVERSEIEVALKRLVDEGRVLHRPTGWKLAPESA